MMDFVLLQPHITHALRLRSPELTRTIGWAVYKGYLFHDYPINDFLQIYGAVLLIALQGFICPFLGDRLASFHKSFYLPISLSHGVDF